jgi:hypothetical protein
LENLLDNEALAKRFLLESLSEAERAQIEDRLLADDEFYQQILIVEDDLIDAYVCGEMPAPERALFEQWYLALPSRRDRVEFARRLFDSVPGKTVNAVPALESERSGSWLRSVSDLFGRRPALGFSLITIAAGLLVLVLGGVWLLARRTQTPPAAPQAQTIQPTPMPVQPRESPQIATAAQPPAKTEPKNSKPPAKERPQRTAPVVSTFTLLPGVVRGQSGTQLVLPAGLSAVRLYLRLDGESAKKYRVTLSTPEGRKVWSRDMTGNSSSRSAQLSLTLPANILNNGDYVIEIGTATVAGGWQTVADYSFRVLRKRSNHRISFGKNFWLVAERRPNLAQPFKAGIDGASSHVASAMIEGIFRCR